MNQQELVARYKYLRAMYDRLELRLDQVDREIVELERLLPDEIAGILPFDEPDFNLRPAQEE